MRMNPYLSFNGQCEAAFKLYEQCLDGHIEGIFRYGGTPMADDVPADWQDKVMHASLMVGDQVLMGGDVAPDHYEKPTGFAVSLHLKSTTEAERIFHELARGRHDCRTARADVLGRALWPGGRSVRDPVADQLRRFVRLTKRRAANSVCARAHDAAV